MSDRHPSPQSHPVKDIIMVLHVFIPDMLESSLEFLGCPRCGSALEMNAFGPDAEIMEGIMQCRRCLLQFPVVQGIPILWDDPAGYLSCRRTLGGRLYRLAATPQLKEFLKACMSGSVKPDPAKPGPDMTALEDRWTGIYQNSRDSEFYSVLKTALGSVPGSGPVLEHGCSIGIMASHLADSHDVVLGADRSFGALMHARKHRRGNLDYVVADSLSRVFDRQKFDLVLAMNILNIVDPFRLLRHISGQIDCGHVMISDPYDYDRSTVPVQKIDTRALRTGLEGLGFEISPDTREPSYIPWHLRINERTTMQYMVDLVVGAR